MKLFGTTALMKSLDDASLEARRRHYADIEATGKRLFSPGKVFVGCSVMTAGVALGLVTFMCLAGILLALEGCGAGIWMKGKYENNLAKKETRLRKVARKAAASAAAAAAAAVPVPAPVLAEMPDLSGDFRLGINKSVAVRTLKLTSPAVVQQSQRMLS